MSPVVDLTGLYFCDGAILAVRRLKSNAQGQAMYLCRLRCDHEFNRSGNALKRAHRLGQKPRCLECNREGRER